ncbi:hypothetical protein FHS29_006635 [Saccharothrix tamanrassetensis]|uniref:Secreted protein n=1 Tax=Saccharothrix tamanrassetensis TaxID=1051531 RepID=A0A841CT19_9PSEU|nr:hypothetical protein [Saccharothrix tamanrassetensis]MBB5960013.1 hypothetical protein [Saccharothrix tamanrassetensis]
MSTGTIIGVIVVVLVVVAAIVLLRFFLQRKRLRTKFGPEYERALERNDNRMAAERELVEREREHSKLELRPLTPGTRESYARNWTRIQEQFVDAPTTAVTQADRLVTDLMAERGYPTEGYERQASLLSVEHAQTLDHYREAHTISERQDRGEASTEDLRTAMVHYRTLFEDLLKTGADDRHADDRHADRRDRTEGAR